MAKRKSDFDLDEDEFDDGFFTAEVLAEIDKIEVEFYRSEADYYI
jgi:hypothetical protein